MKTKIKRTTTEEIDVARVVIDIPLDCADLTAEEADLMAPFIKDDRLILSVDIDTGQIESWPLRAGTVHIYAHPVDSGNYQLLGRDGKELAGIREDNVPNACIPGDYGDYVDLEIDHSGRVTNWPKRVDVSDFFKAKSEDED